MALDIGGTFYKLYPTNVRGPESFASYRIYFPPGYAENPNRRYPVIYFLHGRSVDSKRTVDAGLIAHFDDHLAEAERDDIETVVVCGCATDACVESTARSSAYHDYYTQVVSDCVGSTRPQMHDDAMHVFDTFFTTAPSHEFISTWQAAGPATRCSALPRSMSTM